MNKIFCILAICAILSFASAEDKAADKPADVKPEGAFVKGPIKLIDTTADADKAFSLLQTLTAGKDKSSLYLWGVDATSKKVVRRTIDATTLAKTSDADVNLKAITGCNVVQTAYGEDGTVAGACKENFVAIYPVGATSDTDAIKVDNFGWVADDKVAVDSISKIFFSNTQYYFIIKAKVGDAKAAVDKVYIQGVSVDGKTNKFDKPVEITGINTDNIATTDDSIVFVYIDGTNIQAKTLTVADKKISDAVTIATSGTDNKNKYSAIKVISTKKYYVVLLKDADGNTHAAVNGDKTVADVPFKFDNIKDTEYYAGDWVVLSGADKKITINRYTQALAASKTNNVDLVTGYTFNQAVRAQDGAVYTLVKKDGDDKSVYIGQALEAFGTIFRCSMAGLLAVGLFLIGF